MRNRGSSFVISASSIDCRSRARSECSSCPDTLTAIVSPGRCTSAGSLRSSVTFSFAAPKFAPGTPQSSADTHPDKNNLQPAPAIHLTPFCHTARYLAFISLPTGSSNPIDPVVRFAGLLFRFAFRSAFTRPALSRPALSGTTLLGTARTGTSRRITARIPSSRLAATRRLARRRGVKRRHTHFHRSVSNPPEAHSVRGPGAADLDPHLYAPGSPE